MKLHQLASPFVVSVAVGAVGALTSCAAYGGGLDHSRTITRGAEAPLPFQADSRGVFSLVSVRAAGAVPVRVPSEAEERAMVGKNRPAALVDLGGDASRGTTLTIHGIDASPESVGALSDAALQRGERTLTLAYDDNWRRLHATADDLAALLLALSAEVPHGTSLAIEAHSMGARVVLVALGRLARRGVLEELPISLHLIAPPLSGVSSANWAWVSVPLMETLIPNVAPAKDMGTHNAFQRELDGVTLGHNVRVRVTVGGRDSLVAVDDPFRRRVARLGATLTVVPDLDHREILGHVAAQPPVPPAAQEPITPQLQAPGEGAAPEPISDSAR